jgi:hypothetical protein
MEGAWALVALGGEITIPWEGSFEAEREVEELRPFLRPWGQMLNSERVY